MKFYQDLEITGAIYVSESITVPVIYSTASSALNATTASYVVTAQTASRVLAANVIGTVANTTSASLATTAQTASFVVTALTASYFSGSIVNYPDPYVGTAVVTNVMTLTEDQYLAIPTKNQNTLYLIV